MLFNKMKTNGKVRICKVCAPFFGSELLGKTSIITVIDNGSVFLNELKMYINLDCIEVVNDNSVDEILNEYNVYKPIILSTTEIKII